MKKYISLFIFFAFSLSAFAQTAGSSVIQFGDTINYSVSNYLPFKYGLMGSTVQQMIRASEMNGSCLITGIDLYCTQASAQGRDSCTIYMGHTYQDNLSSGMVAYGPRFELVSTETFACTTGWNHYELDSAFFYNGVDNLVLLVCATNDNALPQMKFAEYFTPGFSGSRFAVSSGQPDVPTSILSQHRSYRNVMRLHTRPATTSRCPAPALRVESVGANAIRMAWTPGSQDTAWMLRCISDNDIAWHSSGLITDDTAYTLTGLTPSTRYEFRLTAFCTDTQTTVTRHIETTCNPATLPYIEGFESATGVSGCWNCISTDSTSYAPMSTTSYHYQGSHSLRLQRGVSVLPLFDAPADSLELHFRTINILSSNSVVVQVVVGVMADPRDMSTFTPVDTISIRGNEGWKPRIVNFSGCPRSNGRIAFMPLNPSLTMNYIYIDDIHVNRISDCPTITGVTVDQTTGNSAVVRWSNTNAQYNEVTYGPEGFNPYTSSVITDIYADSLLLTGLAPNSDYAVYVRSECGEMPSNWSPVVMFHTECGLLDSVPYAEGMEDYATGTLPTAFPCWSGLAKVNTCVVNGSAASPTHTGNRMLRWEQSLSSYGIQHVSLPAIDTAVLPMSTLQLEFWGKGYHFNHYTPYLIVGVMTDPDDMTTFQPVDTVEIGQEYMEHYVVSLENFYGPGRYVTLADYSPSPGYYWTAFLDDIVLSELPPCPEVGDVTITGITDNSATLTIDNTRNAVAWQAYVDTVDSIPSAVTLPLLNTRNVTISLDSSTTNYLWVRAICAKGDTSEWFGPVSIEPGAWNMRAHRSDTLMLCGGTLYDDGGANSYAQPLQNSWITLLPSEPGHLVSVSGSCWKGSFTEVLEIFDADSTLLWTSLGNVNNYYPYNILTFGPCTSTSGLLRLHYTTDSWGGSLDDTSAFIQVQVSCVPDTCVIKHLRADTLVPATDTSIAVTWECNGASLYEIEYGPVGFILGSGTHAIATTEHFAINGLHSLDRRDIYVRSICGEGDTGAWCHATFQTLPCPNAVYRDNYDSTLAQMSYEISPLGLNRAQYTYTQTLIDPAHLAGLEGGITALAVRPDNMASSECLNPVTIYLANVPDTIFDSTFIVPDSQHRFVKVIDSANFNHGLSNDWIVMPFDHPFLWDGHSQVLVAALRNIGGNTYGGAFYSAHRHHRNVTCYHAGYMPIVIDSARTCYADNRVGDIRLFSNLCQTVICATPVIDSVSGDFETASLAWHGDGTDFQLKISPDPNGMGIVSTSANSYTFANLQPATTYTLSLRKDCTEDLLGYSAWVTTSFTTDSFDCLPPSDLALASLTNQSATLTWTADGPCRLRVWNDNDQEWLFADAQSPFTLNNLQSYHTYYATVSSNCGSQHQIAGSWGNTIDFTVSCLPVTGLHTGDITSHSISVVWDSTDNAQSYLLQYGPHPYSLVEGADTVVTGNSCLIDGLAAHTAYDIYVRTRCGEDWYADDYTSITNILTLSREAIDLIASADLNLILQPNPATSQVSVQGIAPQEIVSIKVFNMSGQQVLSVSGSNQFVVDGWPSGSYIVGVLTSDSQYHYLKLIKQ